MKQNLIRKIVGGLSLTSAMFVFQACYGTPQDLKGDMFIEGQVTAKTSGLPIKGIRVLVPNTKQYEITDDNGNFSFYTEMREDIKLQFQDIDSAQNGLYLDKDTVMSEQVFLNITLEEK